MRVKRVKYLPRRHWTPRYIHDRIREGRYRRDHPDWPWLTAPAVELLSAWLKPTDAAVEFGSGRSTLWFARRVGSLTSVEDDRDWYERMSGEVIPLGVDYRLCPTREEYVAPLNELEPGSLDFALVDGSYRDECAVKLLPAMKAGGLLAVDNANWYIHRPRTPSATKDSLTQRSELWEEFERQTAPWRWIWTTDGVTDTAFFVRP